MWSMYLDQEKKSQQITHFKKAAKSTTITKSRNITFNELPIIPLIVFSKISWLYTP